MSGMIERTLIEVLSHIVDNRGRSCPTAESGFPLIATNCVKDDHLFPVFENVRYVSDETRDSWFRGHPEPGDLLFVCKGSPGRVAMVPDPVSFCIAQDMLALRAAPEVVDPRYLYYVLKSKAVREKIVGLHVGTMIPHFKKGDFNKLKLEIHQDLSEQRAIAAVLGALDDKIAANTKLAGVSDELASALFDDALRHAEWSDLTFDDLAAVNGGGTPSTKVTEYWGGGVNWATPTDITGLQGPYLHQTGRQITELGLSACSSALFSQGAILMTSRATIGAFAIAEEPTAVNQGFIVVQPINPSHKWWLFHEMRSRVDEFISLANGATFLELSRGNFRKLRVRLAVESAIHEFDARAGSLHEVARAALAENRTLAATRDTLLPQLMSGKLRVRDAEKLVEAAA